MQWTKYCIVFALNLYMYAAMVWLWFMNDNVYSLYVYVWASTVI